MKPVPLDLGWSFQPVAQYGKERAFALCSPEMCGQIDNCSSGITACWVAHTGCREPRLCFCFHLGMVSWCGAMLLLPSSFGGKRWLGPVGRRGDPLPCKPGITQMAYPISEKRFRFPAWLWTIMRTPNKPYGLEARTGFSTVPRW